MYYVYFNGDFYYPSNDSHYKHGRPIHTEYSEEDARALSNQLNRDKKDHEYKLALALHIEAFNKQWAIDND